MPWSAVVALVETAVKAAARKKEHTVRVAQENFPVRLGLLHELDVPPGPALRKRRRDGDDWRHRLLQEEVEARARQRSSETAGIMSTRWETHEADK